MTIPFLAMANKALYMKHALAFKRIFDADLKTYFDWITGFDVIKFDELIKPDDAHGESTADKVRKEYGDEAVKLCFALLGEEPADEGEGE